MKNIIVFTDGATPNNQSKNLKKGGIGVYFGDNNIYNISKQIIETEKDKVTNQVCETMACIIALETIVSTQKIGKKEITLYTDSMYLVNAMTSWAKTWKKNNWMKSNGKLIENMELIQKLYYLSINLKVTYIHVKAHTKAPPLDSDEYNLYWGNYMADKLASNAAKL
jgi:ribonuclease HI